MGNDAVVHDTTYRFDKDYNYNDDKVFVIFIGEEKYNLRIDFWNKIKANIIHHRYLLDKEKEWFIKTIIATAIGAIFALIGAYVGYKIGIQSQQIPKTTIQPDKPPTDGR